MSPPFPRTLFCSSKSVDLWSYERRETDPDEKRIALLSPIFATYNTIYYYVTNRNKLNLLALFVIFYSYIQQTGSGSHICSSVHPHLSVQFCKSCFNPTFHLLVYTLFHQHLNLFYFTIGIFSLTNLETSLPP